MLLDLYPRCHRCGVVVRRAVRMVNGQPACQEHVREAMQANEYTLAPLPKPDLRALAVRVAGEWLR